MKKYLFGPALLLALAMPAKAQSVTWQLINEYPATALTGEADRFFADTVKDRTNGRVLIEPVPDAKSGLRTKDQLKAVSEGRYAMANSFAGALADESAIFLLSSLPFLTPTPEHARALYEAAAPLYERLFAERGQKLLYVSPWPPSGVWSSEPLSGRAALAALKIRTYDKTGTEVFGQVAAAANVVSFADLNARLESGDINAVLSSGDGGAGRQLWKYLKYFSEITYAIPLSFGSVSLAEWNKLDEATRRTIEQAGRETTDRQWQAMNGRVEKNYAIMRENGVTITRPPLEVTAALAAAASKSLIEWHTKAGPEAARAVQDYQARSLK
ncbi:MAG TPA: TRAP transporter substrate-binding protein [Pseudorhodoplanes sp.]|nr:TRAP transporter substrate-binding protein [Pseudorhodoplanes sp.]